MTDEQQPPQPEEPKTEPTIAEKRKNHRGALEKLPIEVRRELDEQIKITNPSTAKKYMVNKFGKEYPILAAVGTPSWYEYAKRHGIKGINKELKAEIVSTTPELLNAIDKITDQNVSITDKKAALTRLYHDCDQTSKRLEATQINFMDPQIQAVILANRKQMCIIVEKLAVINDQLSKDSDKNWLEEAEMLIQVCTSAVVNSYKITHKDQTLFSKFMSDYRSRLVDSMKSYRATKETLKKEPIKIA